MSNANDLWFLRMNALSAILKETHVMRHLNCGFDKVDEDNKQMDAALARIWAILHNEEQEERLLQEDSDGVD